MTHINRKQVAFIVTVASIGEGAKKFDPYFLLEQSWQAGFGRMGNRVIYKKRINYRGHPGLEHRFRGKNFSHPTFSTGRIILVGGTYYAWDVILPEAFMKEDYAPKFLESFRLK
jgi:hypothetical protein